MLDFPIVDSHVHLWDTKRLGYPWMVDEPSLAHEFDVDDLEAAIEPQPWDACVFVQAECLPEQTAAEIEMVLEQAREEPRLKGIVARAALERGPDAVREVLARYAAEPLIKGVRRLIQWEEDPGFCTAPDFVAATRLLAEHDLSFDLCIFHHQLAAATELVKACPDVRFVLDHLGKPDVKSGQLQPWEDDLDRLAELRNVHCKLSGLATEADHVHWEAEQLRPYLRHAIRAFGNGRILYGSDWPVSTLAIRYARWVEILAEATSGLGEDGQRLFFRENAVEFYRLEL